MTRGTLILLDSENLFHPFIPYTNLAKLTATGAGLGRKAQLSQYLIPPGELKQGAAAHKTRMLVDELTSWVEQHYGHIASSTAFAYRNDGGHRIARPSLRNAGFRLVEHDPQRKNQADYAIVQELASIGARGCPDHMILIT